MHEILVRTVAAAMLAFATGSASAVTVGKSSVKCHVSGSAKLSEQSGGVGALCAAIEAALGEQVPAQNLSVEITVLGPSRISALVTSDTGRKLAEQKYGSMDRELTRSSFERFANGLAAEISKAKGRN
jgi:hypothetical protein